MHFAMMAAIRHQANQAIPKKQNTDPSALIRQSIQDIRRKKRSGSSSIASSRPL